MEFHPLQDGWIKLPVGDVGDEWKGAPSGRLLLGLNQLFLRIGGRNVLVDTGLGDKRSSEELGLLGFEAPRRLLGELAAFFIFPDDVDIVVLTHLHYDHSGGATRREGSRLAPTFTNALYYIQVDELNYARALAAKGARSINPDDYEPLAREGRLIELNGDDSPLSGLKVFKTPGHTPGHQVVLANEGETTIFYGGDLIATRRHTRRRLNPAHNSDAVEMKRLQLEWAKRAVDSGWLCVFAHELREPVGEVRCPA